MEVSVGSWPAANPVNLDRLANEEVTAGEGTGGSGVSSSATQRVKEAIFYRGVSFQKISLIYLRYFSCYR